MTITKLVEKLNELKSIHGDLEVCQYNELSVSEEDEYVPLENDSVVVDQKLSDETHVVVIT